MLLEWSIETTFLNILTKVSVVFYHDMYFVFYNKILDLFHFATYASVAVSANGYVCSVIPSLLFPDSQETTQYIGTCIVL